MLNSTRWQRLNRNLFALSFIGLFFQRRREELDKKTPSFLLQKWYWIIKSWCSTPSSMPFIKGGCVFCISRAHSPSNTSTTLMLTATQMNYTFVRLAAFKQLYFETSGFTFFTNLMFDRHAQVGVWVPHMAWFWLVVFTAGRRMIQARITFFIAKFHAMLK